MDTPPRGWVGSKGFGEKVGFQVGFGEKSGIWGKSWRESGIRVDLGEEVSAAVGGRKTHFTRRKALRNRIFFSVLVVESKKKRACGAKIYQDFFAPAAHFLKIPNQYCDYYLMKL